jgi:mannose-6-phosphate isomerase-like protein (cupin superfamily)
MRAWVVTAIAAFNIHAAPGQVYEVFKCAEIDARIEKLAQPAAIYQGANFTISLNSRSGVEDTLESDSEVDKILSIRSGTGTLVLNNHPYTVGADDLISVPRGTAHRLSALSGPVRWVEIRFFGKGIPRDKLFFGLPRVLPASEIAGAFANDSQTRLDAPTFWMTYASYSHSKGAEEHSNHGHIYLVKSGHAAVELGGELQNPKEERRGTMSGTGIANARRYEIGPGDIVVIPPNTAHDKELSGERLGYVFFWVRLN